MARLIKRSQRTGAPWYADFYAVDSAGRRKRKLISTGTSDKATAKQIATKLEADAALRTHRLIDPLEETMQKEATRPLQEHLAAYRDKLLASGSGELHVDRTLKYIREFAQFGGIHSIGGIHSDAATGWARSLKERGRSARTVQARLTAIKGLTKWLTVNEKLLRDPLARVTKPGVAEDRRRERRMLLPTEWVWLSHATLQSGEQFGMPASERLLLYRTAIQTGLRASELRSLRRGDFYLDGDRPYLRVSAAVTKNAKVAYQYVDAALSSDLKAHLSQQTKMPKAPAFDLPTEFCMADMLRADLAEARKAWLEESSGPHERSKREQGFFLQAINEAGHRLDFHALRHTCGAWLAIRGVQPKVIQSVMRHSSITLTLDTYGHMIEGAEAAAIASTADMTSLPAVLAATGTDPAATETCFAFDSKQGALACVEYATECGEGSSPERRLALENAVIPYSELREFAPSGDSLRQGTENRAGRTRTRDLGIMSPQL